MFMKPVLHELPYLENWRWLSRRIRCAMEPDEPRLIDHYLAEGRYLVCCTETSAWTVALTSFRLLLDTACDRMLPWHWRCLCLDQAWKPLLSMRMISADSLFTIVPSRLSQSTGTVTMPVKSGSAAR